MFTYAIVRKPDENFREGITTYGLGVLNLDRTLKQHNTYCQSLKKCGLKLIVLESD